MSYMPYGEFSIPFDYEAFQALILDPSKDEFDLEWQCPSCGWETDDMTYYDDPQVFLGFVSWSNSTHPELPFHAAHWIELWKCPYCDTMFEVSNSNY